MSVQLVATVISDALKFRRLSDPTTGLASGFIRNWRRVAWQSVNLAKKSILEAMASSALAPLSPATIALKGHDKMLVESGKLKDSIVAKEESRNVFYGGVDANKQNDKGMSMGWLATLHQTGYTIEVTPDVRARFKQAGMHIRNDTKFLVVPPRPFVMIGLEKAVQQIQKRFIGLTRTIPTLARTI